MLKPHAFIEGLGLSAGLIIAIGAQNAFVLRQGILKRHVFITAAICSLIDLSLITAGVLGLGAVLNRIPLLMIAAAAGGSLLLFIYGIRSFVMAYKPKVLDHTAHPGSSGKDLRSDIMTLLALSLLNPHVYLDTVILLGGIGASRPPAERLSFITGASTASVGWFFSLAYGSGFLAPLFRQKTTWRILDFVIGCIMLFISFKLVQYILSVTGQ